MMSGRSSTSASGRWRRVRGCMSTATVSMKSTSPTEPTGQFNDFVAFLGQPAPAAGSIMDALYDHVRAIHGSSTLDDDFSILEAAF